MGARISLTNRELKKWVRNPILLIVALVQPLFWIILFGNAFNITALVPKSEMATVFLGASNYISYLTPGMLAIIILFTAMFSGASIIWDRRLGFMTRLIVAPIPRDSIVTSKVFASLVKSIIQASVLLVVALLIPNGMRLSSTFNIMDLGVLYLILILLALGFSSLFAAIVIRVKKWETLMGIMNLINLPLMFASTAMFPVAIMPDWLKTIASYNPISWAASSMRLIMIKGNLTSAQWLTTWLDIGYLAIFVAAMFVIVIVLSKYSFEE